MWPFLFQGNELLLSDEQIRVLNQSQGEDIPFKVHTMGLYVVIEASNGLILIWNKKTTLMIKLSSSFKVSECISRFSDSCLSPFF